MSAYVDAFGKVRYITSVGEAKKDSFIGYVGGLKTMQGIDKTKEALITNLDDETFPVLSYKLTEKSLYIDNSSNESDAYTKLYDTLFPSQGAETDKLSAKRIFRFKVNGNGEITRVTDLSPYFGYATDDDGFVKYSFSGQYPQTGDPTNFSINSKQLFLSKSEKITVLYDKEGEAAFGVTSYKELEEKHTSGTNTLTFFGGYMSSEFDLILLTGDVANMSADKKRIGIIDSVRTGIDDEGDPIKLIEIDGTAYTISDANATGLKKNMIVYYSVNLGGFASYDINILETLDLTGDFDSWAGLSSTGGTVSLSGGTVAKIDSKRLFITDENDVIDAFFFSDSGCRYASYNEERGEFEDGSSYEVGQGSEIIYITSGGMISYIFYIN